MSRMSHTSIQYSCLGWLMCMHWLIGEAAAAAAAAAAVAAAAAARQAALTCHTASGLGT